MDIKLTEEEWREVLYTITEHYFILDKVQNEWIEQRLRKIWANGWIQGNPKESKRSKSMTPDMKNFATKEQYLYLLFMHEVKKHLPMLDDAKQHGWIREEENPESAVDHQKQSKPTEEEVREAFKPPCSWKPGTDMLFQISDIIKNLMEANLIQPEQSAAEKWEEILSDPINSDESRNILKHAELMRIELENKIKELEKKD
jgi:hypothetical protein